METNRHHLFWTKAEYNKGNVTRLIRNHHLSIQEMVVDIHRDLHANIAPVSPPEIKVARGVLFLLNNAHRRSKPLYMANKISESLHDTEADYLATQLDEQIPFIELSLEAMKKRHIT